MKKSTLLASIALFSTPIVSRAAVVTWQSKPYTVNGNFGQFIDTGVIDKTGVLTYAENAGGSALTFDGIPFSSASIPFAGGSWFAGFFDPVSPLAATGAWGGNGSVGTVTFGTGSLPALTLGQAYRIQLIIFDGRGDQAGRSIKVDNLNMGQYANGVSGVTWGPGLLVTGTFTADTATQGFTLETISGGTPAGPHLNGLILQAVPEPSSAFIGGLCVIGLLNRRRR